MIRDLLIVVVLLTACGHAPQQAAQRRLPWYNSADFSPHWDLPAEGTTFHHIPAFTLSTQTGEAFTEKEMDGRICVSNFFFTTCPGICRRMTTLMDTVQAAFRSDSRVLLLSHSVTPEKDSVAALRAFGEARGIAPARWKLLTGNRNSIYELGRKAYFVEEDLGLSRDTSVFLHTENFVLTDGKRRIRGIYNGLDLTSIRALIEDIRALEQE